jgi:hypothetical protein
VAPAIPGANVAPLEVIADAAVDATAALNLGTVGQLQKPVRVRIPREPLLAR